MALILLLQAGSAAIANELLEILNRLISRPGLRAQLLERRDRRNPLLLDELRDVPGSPELP